MQKCDKYTSLLDALRAAAYPVRRKVLRQAAALMSAAFHDDPSIRYLLGGRNGGTNDWRYFYTVLRAIYGKTVILSTGEDMTGLLILFPPWRKAVPALGFMLGGGLGLWRYFGADIYHRSMNYEGNCQRIKASLSPRGAWYCMCFVVAPERQGRGVGSRLIRPVLAELDARHIPLYLETHKAVNVELYRHLGFRMADVSSIPGTNITQYAMLRE